MHADLLKLRRKEPVFRAQRRGAVDGAVLGPQAFVLRYFGGEPGASAPGGTDDRLLVVNFGRDLHLDPAPEPLLAPPAGCLWQTEWSSEDIRYGGTGTPPVETEDDSWRIPGEAAVVLRPTRKEE